MSVRANQVLVPGTARGAVLATNAPLSFWGGVDPATGLIIDSHHELCGQNLTNRIFVMPSGRGSCTASVVLLECILLGHAPCAILLAERDEVIALGVILADELYSRSIPVVVLTADDFTQVMTAEQIELHADGSCSLVDLEQSVRGLEQPDGTAPIGP